MTDEDDKSLDYDSDIGVGTAGSTESGSCGGLKDMLGNALTVGVLVVTPVSNSLRVCAVLETAPLKIAPMRQVGSTTTWEKTGAVRRVYPTNVVVLKDLVATKLVT